MPGLGRARRVAEQRPIAARLRATPAFGHARVGPSATA
jgi:hypothetical protein